jgi:DNA-binding IclR family transcriptional regulator
MLQNYQMVQQDTSLKTYVPGPALIELGLAALREIDIRAYVQPFLEQLVAEVGETAHLVARRGRSVIYLDCVESEKSIRAGSRTGKMTPCHCTAAGKVLLAELDDDAIKQLYPEHRLPGLTQNSIRSRSDLLQELARIRSRRFATNGGESEDGLAAVAVVVRDPRNRAVGAIAVAGPSFRFGEESLPRVAGVIARYAAAITVSLAQTVAPAKMQPIAR